MDKWPVSISPHQLNARLGNGLAPVVIDIRGRDALASDGRLIIGAFHGPHDEMRQWSAQLQSSRPIVVYCRDGQEDSQNAASALRGAGLQAAYLEGGMSAWKEAALPTRSRAPDVNDHKWVTREHPKIDRIACPWLISRFINPLAEFIYVPANEVPAYAERTGAIPYDIKGVRFGHHGERCSFDAIVDNYDVHDPALDRLATIVRGADTARPDLAPQCEGLLAISRGLSANFPDDHDMLRHGLVIYDALYTGCRLEVQKQQQHQIS